MLLRARSLPPGLLFLLLSCIACVPFFAGYFPAVGDMRDVYIPLEIFFQEQQRQFNLPAWQPLAAWGFPVIASGQIGFFYPPLLLARQLLPLPVYLPTLIILHLSALGLGTYLLARQYKQSHQAALLASISFTLGAFVWQHLIHLNIFLILPWLPWQLWYTNRLRHQPTLSLRHISILAILLATPFLIGQFQIPTLIAAVSTLHLLFLRWHNQPARFTRSTLLPLIITAALAIGLAATQILPTLELIPHSSRDTDSGQFDVIRANQYSYPLYHLPTLLFPRFYDTDSHYWGKRLEIEYGFFLGTIPLFLTTYWLWKHRSERTREDTFWLSVGLLTFLLALGSLSPFRLLGFEPSLWVFSAPARWLLFTSLSLSLLAGRALDTIRLNTHTWRTFILFSLLSTGAVIAVANIILFAPSTLKTAVYALETIGQNTPYNQEKILSLITSAQTSSLSLRSPYTYLPLFTLTALLILHRQPGRRQKTAIITLTTLELLIINPTLLTYRPWSEVFSKPATIENLPDTVRTGQARLYTIQSPNTDTGAFFTNPSSRPDPTEDAKKRQLLIPLIHTQYGLAGIQWPASLDFAAQEQAIAAIYDENSSQPANIEAAQALTIGAIVAPASLPLPALAAQDTSTVADTTIYKLDPEPHLTLTNQRRQSIGSITASTITPTGNIHLQTNNAEPANLIIRDTFYPGWQATVNNNPATIHLEPPLFRRIALPAGQNDITVTYQPRLLYVGIATSLTAALFCVLILVFTKNSRSDKLQS